MVKIVTVCGAGVGSSLMLKVFVQQILNAENIECSVEASDISSVNPNEYEILITTSDFAKQLRASTAHIIRIDNMMDKKYLKEQLMNYINQL